MSVIGSRKQLVFGKNVRILIDDKEYALAKVCRFSWSYELPEEKVIASEIPVIVTGSFSGEVRIEALYSTDLLFEELVKPGDTGQLPEVTILCQEKAYEQKTITGESLGTGDGSTTTFYTAHKPIVKVKAVYLDGVEQAADTYEVYPWDGKVVFDTAPGTGVAITIDYTYAPGTYWTLKAMLNEEEKEVSEDRIVRATVRGKLTERPVKQVLT